MGSQYWPSNGLSTFYGGSGSAQAFYESRAATLTGITDQTLHRLNWTDFGVSTDYSFAGSGGGTSAPNISVAGGLRVNAGATAGAGGTINIPGFGTVFESASLAQKRWYICGGWRLNTNAPNSDTRLYFMISNGTIAGSVAFGINGRAQTAKYAFSFSAADALTTSPALTVVSTVAPSVGPWTGGEMWFDGVSVFGSINQETPIVVGAGSGLVNSTSTPIQFISLPAAASQVDMPDVDYMGFWMEQ